MTTRLQNKNLNRLGYYWVKKFDSETEYRQAKEEVGVGRGMYHYSSKSKQPHWLILKQYES